MEETYISFETAKLSKEKGIDLPHTHYYVYPFRSFKADGVLKRNATNDDYNHNLLQQVNTRKMQPHMAPAYTQSLLQKWLREEHEIILFAQHETIDDAESAWTWTIKKYIPEGVEGTRKKKEYDFWKCHYSFSYENMMWWKTYEEALEDGILKALKLIK